MFNPHFSVIKNIILAFVPLSLSLVLFRSDRRRKVFWWAGVLVFVAFLPNAPYTLTDVIHLIADIRQRPPLPVWYIGLILTPLYILYMLACFQAYVISLVLVGNYLSRHGLKRWIFPSELILSFLCAIGIYLGRFQRLNSWHLITGPNKVIVDLLYDFSHRAPIVVIFFILIVIFGLFCLFKVVDLTIWRNYVIGKRSLTYREM